MTKNKTQDSFSVLWVALIFLVLAISFVLDLWGEKRQIIQHAPTDPKHYTKEPVRQATLEPIYEYEGKMYGCNECHNTLEVTNVQKSYFSAHPDVILEHGANNHCQTCHNRGNMDLLKDINNNDVTFARSHVTCLQCHGPIYRDWEQGLHGRMNDFLGHPPGGNS